MGNRNDSVMSPLDALFLQVEDGISHMHIGSCAIFEGPAPSIGEVTRLIGSKLPRLTRYRQKVRFVPGGLGRPVWVDAPDFDLDHHVRHSAVPPASGDDALERLMGRLMSQELDRRRPLWEVWMIEGLGDGRWALISKVHHCMVDGIAGTDLIATMLDADREAAVAEAEPWNPSPEPSGLELAVRAAARLATDPARRLARLSPRDLGPRAVFHRVGEVAGGLRSFARVIAPVRPMSITGPIGPHRRWSAGRCRLDEVKAISRAFGCSVNDVMLSAVTGALRSALLDRDEPVADDLVVRSLVPVSVRRPGDRTANNQVSLIIAELPVGIVDPLSRLSGVSDLMARLKASHEATAGAAVLAGAELVPPALVAAGVRASTAVLRRHPQRTINTVTTNVPGPQFPLFALGREMVEYLPYVPLAEGVRLGVAIISYNGRISWGVTGDDDGAPDVHLMAQRIEAEIAGLGQLSRRRQRRTS